MRGRLDRRTAHRQNMKTNYTSKYTDAFRHQQLQEQQHSLQQQTQSVLDIIQKIVPLLAQWEINQVHTTLSLWIQVSMTGMAVNMKVHEEEAAATTAIIQEMLVIGHMTIEMHLEARLGMMKMSETIQSFLPKDEVTGAKLMSE